jgi:hypothetical protein
MSLAQNINIFFNKQANICFVFLRPQIEKQLKAMKNIASNAIGSQRYSPLNEHDSKSQAGNLRTETLKSNGKVVE